MFSMWDKYTSFQPLLLYHYINNKFTTLYRIFLFHFLVFWPWDSRLCSLCWLYNCEEKKKSRQYWFYHPPLVPCEISKLKQTKVLLQICFPNFFGFTSIVYWPNPNPSFHEISYLDFVMMYLDYDFVSCCHHFLLVVGLYTFFSLFWLESQFSNIE